MGLFFMKYALTFILLTIYSCGFTQRRYYFGSAFGFQQMALNVRDNGNELLPINYSSPWPGYSGGQGGVFVHPKIALETGIYTVPYWQIVPIKRFSLNGASSGLSTVSVPVTVAWNIFSVPFTRHIKLRVIILGGISNFFVTHKNSSGNGSLSFEVPQTVFELKNQYSSKESPAYFYRLYAGFQGEVLISNRVGVWFNKNFVVGGKEIFTTHIQYTLNGISNTATVAATGGSKVTQIGIRYYFGSLLK